MSSVVAAATATGLAVPLASPTDAEGPGPLSLASESRHQSDQEHSDVHVESARPEPGERQSPSRSADRRRAQGWLSPREIARAVGDDQKDVARTGPVIEEALRTAGLNDTTGRIAVLATVVTDGARFHGRGYISLTTRSSYRSYGRRIELPLDERPGMTLRPEVGAGVPAEYFKGWSTYRGVVTSLKQAARD